MPRAPRIVFPGVPHHVTQRGNRRGPVFFSDDDRRSYLALLREYTTKHDVQVLAYCLMPNHAHLVLVPRAADGLHRALKPVHMRHAQRLNHWRDWTGHLWQGRFFSSPLDENYLWAAIRYVELNPVRAGLVETAATYAWSSAARRCRGSKDANLAYDSNWQRRFAAIGDWSAFLASGVEASEIRELRKQSQKGLPCGTDDFVDELERRAGRRLRGHSPGRPRRSPEIG